MKKLLFGLSLITVTLFFSCEKNEPIVTVKFQETESTIVAEGGSADFVLELTGADNNTYLYTASIAGDGFSINKTDGDLASTGEIFTVTATPNSNQTERTGTLTVYMPNLDITLTATITQFGRLLLDISQYDRDKGEAGKANRSNCYIIPIENGPHKLSIERIDDYWAGTDPLYGGNTPENTIAENQDLQAVVVWSDFDYTDKVSISTNASDKSMVVEAKDLPSLGGNMVVAVTKADGTTILWSWHLWFSDIDTTVSTELPSGQKIMDRNLGAQSIDGLGVETFGLLYQWGRKDPLPNAQNMTDGRKIIYTPTGVGSFYTKGSIDNSGSIALSIANPFTFYNSTPDWIFTGIDSMAENSRRWNSSEDSLEKGTKTIFDPCPYGWRMPWGKTWLTKEDEPYGYFLWKPGTVNGCSYKNNANAFFPAAGLRYNVDAMLILVNEATYYWSGSSGSSMGSWSTYFADAIGRGNTRRHLGLSVRPVQDI